MLSLYWRLLAVSLFSYRCHYTTAVALPCCCHPSYRCHYTTAVALPCCCHPVSLLSLPLCCHSLRRCTTLWSLYHTLLSLHHTLLSLPHTVSLLSLRCTTLWSLYHSLLSLPHAVALSRCCPSLDYLVPARLAALHCQMLLYTCRRSPPTATCPSMYNSHM